MNPIPPFLALLSLGIASCDPETKVAKASAPGAIEIAFQFVPENVLSGWGYRTVSTFSRSQSDWETGKFGGAKVRVQSIKSLQEVPDWKDAYYRFTLVEETFASNAVAESRFKRLKESDPMLDSKQYPDLILRDGFTAGNKVLYVTTDVSKFEIERLHVVVDSLKSHVLGPKEGEATQSDGRKPEN